MSRKTRKLIWSAPLVAVLAVIGALAIFAAQPPEPALAHDIPGAVGDLKAEAQEDGSIKLTWNAPSTGGNPTGYRIDYLPKATGSIWKLLEADAGSATTYTDSALGSETGRDYRVFAFNEHGTGPVSKVAGAAIPDAGAPGKVPTFATPQVAGYSQLNLSWTAPEKDGGSPITSYRIVMAATAATVPANADAVTPNPSVTLAAGDPTTIDTGSDATTYSVMGLRAQQTWHISIYARNKAGMNSPDSTSSTAAPIVRTQITGPAGKPVAATNLVATFVTPNVDLYWLGPTDDGGADIVKYRIEVRKSGKNWPKATTAVSADLNADIDGTNGFGVAEVQKTALTTAYDFRHDVTATPDLSGETLQYRVIAVTGTGQDEMVGPESSGVTIRLVANSNQPGAPTANATAFADGQTPTSIDLNWVAPTDNPGSGYRIDYKKGASGSTDPWMPLVTNTNFTNLQYTHSNLMPAVAEADRSYVYRIFNIKAGVTGPAFRDTGISATITAPGAPTGLAATVVNGQQVDLTWKAPKENGGVPVTEYFVHVASASTDLGATDAIAPMPAPCATAVDAVFRTKSADLDYSVKGLCAQKTYNFAVTAYNGDPFTGTAPEATRRSAALSNTVAVVTDAIGSIEAPNGLVAEAAQDNNLTGGTERGVLLIWNAPADPTGGKLVTYEIERKVDDGDYIDLADGMLSGTNGDATNPYTGPITYHTDESEPKADETRMYRIRAKGQVLNATNEPVTTETVTSAWVEVSYDLMGTPDHSHTMVPGKPTASAMADSDTQITVSWTDPADNGGADIMSYIIERRYMGDMMGDIPSDGYNDAAGGRTFAFSDHMEWWETLNCKGMLAAAGIMEADATDEQKDMYCKHFADTMPTDMAFEGKTVSEDTAMKIKALFDKRFVLIDDATTMMYEDMGLMAATEYTYRVSAVNSVGRSMWSAPAMATTNAAPLTPPENVMASHDGLEVTVTWEGGMNADTFYVSLLRRDDEGNWDIPNATFDPAPNGSPFTVNMSNRPAGTYHVFVIAGSEADGWSNWVSGSLNYAP